MPWTVGLTTAEAKQVTCTRARATGSGDLSSEPISCALGHQCYVPQDLLYARPDQLLHRSRNDKQREPGGKTSGLCPVGQACLAPRFAGLTGPVH